ncbi:MAG: glutathione S-transferase N-terminal domain-containing protein [Gammaproteobacteria bacterium]|nr:glutathione S-transferase N-terminal domain-containing protein [Gammaproteobacteria bacterium]
MTVLKRSTMTLYSGANDIASHRVRIVLAEKDVTVDILFTDPNNPPEDLLTLNPYNSLPTLVDRDLVLYQVDVIAEYLDERFPHPPLLPVYPIARAKCRLMIHRIDNDWLSLISIIQKGKKNEADDARKALRDQLITTAPIFAEMPYFLSEDFTLVDCYLAAILWRLPSFGIELPASAKAIHDYAERIFKRDSFQTSLSEAERELRE